MLRRLTLPLLVALFFIPSAAAAQGRTTPRTDWTAGARAGFSLSPDQFIVGGHLESPDLPQQFLERLTFRPTFEVGISDDDTRVMAHLEFALWAPFPDTPFSAYAVIGPGLELSNNAGGVVTFGVGVQHEKGYFAELKYLSGEARIVGGLTINLSRR
jgi:hypothetical protein